MEYVIKSYVKLWWHVCWKHTCMWKIYIYVDGDGRKGECDGLMVCLIIFMLFNQLIYLVDCV